ncbi:predicted protein [Uncinocarpus reesii 1704]|uniref:C6 finger domain transcription factor nscR n=1 Tax=Uncinocarpus reesii (strain UAMH 1704) TaxID=336963 RepID=C4JEK7_UNCRE|nr:uncharacterized protein UREG_00846 [Uncinocarpus reesii 1704]EEP75999.1 predicted protein [Uncinocarpus reesii 1704]
MAPHAPSKRLPVSCEPCRKRKIRCTRNGPPCETCLRRDSGPTAMHLSEAMRRQSPAKQQPDPSQRRAPPAYPEISRTCSGSIFFDPSDPSAYRQQDMFVSNPSRPSLAPNVAQESTKEYFRELDASSREEHCGFPFSTNPSASRRELMSYLPPRQYCDRLKDAYFRVFSPLFHVLHDPTFEAEYSRFREDAASASLSWLALLFVVLAIAVNGLDENDCLLPDLGRESTAAANIRVLSARYRAAAMHCLAADEVMSRHSLHTFQTLVLLIYALTHSSQPCWVLIGMTHHVAIAMGCHLDPDHFNLGVVEAEKRRRCWAALVMLHMTQKISFRNLDQQKLSRDVRLPAEANDTDLVDGRPLPLPSGPTQMTYLLFKFRMYDIAYKICSEIFGLQQPSHTMVKKLDGEISAQQEAWNTRYLGDTKVYPLPSHHVAHMNILFGYSHQLFLLLHRPVLNRYLTGEINDVTRSSRDRCLDSAKGLLAIQKTLSESPEFTPYKWYTAGLASFHAFHAAVVLAVIMMSSNNNTENEEIRNILMNSLQVFKVLSSRSSLCEKAVPILGRLINLTTTRPNTSQRSPLKLAQTQHCSYPSPSSTASTSSNVTQLPSASVLPDAHHYLHEQQQLAHSHTLSQPQLQAQSQPHCSPFIDPQAEAVHAQLQAQYWLGPSGISWETWGFLGNEHFTYTEGSAT